MDFRSNFSILLVDDEKSLLENLYNFLKDKGFKEVYTAKNLKESRFKLENYKIDLVVLDLMLPDGSGFDLLKEVGKRCTKPILLKRGLSSTYEEWIMSAEYIMASGNPNVILCERGIRTFESYTRNTLDLQAIPVIKRLTHLPIIIDPSHAGGKWWLVEPMAKAAVAAGCDGLMIEVHNDPEHALCDGPQSLKPKKYTELLRQVKGIGEIVGKKI